MDFLGGIRSFFNRLLPPDKGSQLGPTSATGTVGESTVTDERALQIATVWACVRLISNVTSNFPLDFYEKKGNGRTKLKTDYSLVRLLAYTPNKLMTATSFRMAMTMQLALYGNAYALIERNRVGDIISLIPLLSAKMDVILENQEVIFKYRRDREYVKYKRNEIFHLCGHGINGIVGLSPIAYASKTAGVAIAMEDHQHEFYANGGKSPKILTTGQSILTREQREQVEENFKEISGGSVKKRLWILEAGFDTKDIGVSPQDAEMMAARGFQVAEIARFFGVPPHLVGATEKTTSWGTGIQDQNLGFLQYNLESYLTIWEDSIKRWLIPAKDVDRVYAEHNVDSLLRGDSKTRIENIRTEIEAGTLTPNEARAFMNRDPLPGGDILIKQSQYVPMTKLGQENENIPKID